MARESGLIDKYEKKDKVYTTGSIITDFLEKSETVNYFILLTP